MEIPRRSSFGSSLLLSHVSSLGIESFSGRELFSLTNVHYNKYWKAGNSRSSPGRIPAARCYEIKKEESASTWNPVRSTIPGGVKYRGAHRTRAVNSGLKTLDCKPASRKNYLLQLPDPCLLLF